MRGIILGKSTEDIIDFYIVLLDEPLKDGTKAVSMTEVLLRRVNSDVKEDGYIK